MSYEVLARRFRPQTLDDVVGQAHVTTSLRNAIEGGQVPHALLLCGPRGVGKTSIARILARSLNCDEGPTVSPCGKCSSCTEIANGTSLDVQEIDAASHTGVDNVREIRDSIRYAAAPGKHRIFIIDEVHMLSIAAFNALLKTLEEPPPNSLFVLATTDPQKIPQTVLSRVQRYDLKRLGSVELRAMLDEMISKEGIEMDESVARALVREGDGSGRDMQTLLDRLLAALGKKIGTEEARAILDLIDRRVLVEITDPVLAGDAPSALTALRRAFDKGIEPRRLATDLLGEIRNLMVARLVEDASGLIDGAEDEVEELRSRAKSSDPEHLQRLFRVLLTRIQDLGFAPRSDHALEMAVIRLATMPQSEDLRTLMARVDALSRGGDGGGGPSGGAGGSGREGGRPRSRDTRNGDRSGDTRSRGPRGEGATPPRPPARAAGTPAPPAMGEPPAPLGDESPLRLGDEPPLRLGDEPPLMDDRASDRRDRSRAEAEVRNRMKTHPLVLEVIHELDAELREIRVPNEPRAQGPTE